MLDRRGNPRKRSYLGGIIAFNNRCATLSCVVRNVSVDGAQIVLDGSVLLPAEFDLTIPRHDRSYRARMVWRDATRAGLVLLDPSAGTIIPLDWAKRLKSREAENVTLRRRMADLSHGD